VSHPALVGENDDAEFRRLIYGLFVTAGRLETIREAFGRAIGVTGTQYSMLMAVARLQGADGIGVRRLADHLHVAAPHVTTEIGKLVRLGLVAKRPNPEDRRGVLIRLTKAGEGAVDRLAGFVVDINDILFDGVDRHEFKTVLRFVDRFVGNTGRAIREVEGREVEGREVEKRAAVAHSEAAE